MTIKYDLINNYPDLLLAAKKEGVLFTKNTLMFIVEEEAKIIGCCGVLISGTTAKFKALFVYQQYRKKGVGSACIEYRKEFIKAHYKGIKKFKANCTEHSYRLFLKQGFQITREFKNGIKEMTYENILTANRS